jgi:hypothetical protein
MPHFVDNGDGTVTDHQTGLIWEKKDNTCPGIHCVTDTYQWSSSGTAPDGGAFTSFLNTLNGGATGVGSCVSADGSTITGGVNNDCDWRLPTIAELQTIIDSGASNCGNGTPCIDPVFGPTAASIYWSSTTDAGGPIGAWDVNLFVASVSRDNKGTSLFVRAVRGPRAPSTTPRFVDNGDGTVTDHQTGLIWEKKDNTCPGIHCVTDTYSWISGSTPPPDGTAFTSFLNTLNGGATGVGSCVSADGSTITGGFNNDCDWRLPTIAELQTIVDLGASGCGSGSLCIDPVFGPTAAFFYWSSTTFGPSPLFVWRVDFRDGSVSIGFKGTNFPFVRAVRGGS